MKRRTFMQILKDRQNNKPFKRFYNSREQGFIYIIEINKGYVLFGRGTNILRVIKTWNTSININIYPCLNSYKVVSLLKKHLKDYLCPQFLQVTEGLSFEIVSYIVKRMVREVR
jgi:hypothetical protein